MHRDVLPSKNWRVEMVALPKENKNTTAYKLDAGEIKEMPREYLGMSAIGHKCTRFLQLSNFWAYEKSLPKRVDRIFRLGHMLEELIIEDLKRIGVTVTDQQAEIVGAYKHWKGHIDGIAHNVPEAPKTPHLVEFKSHNDASFKGVVKHGVKLSKREHYDQMQRYMLGMKLTRALYIAYNKNDSKYHIERIEFDSGYAKNLEKYEFEVLFADRLYPRIKDNPSWYECKFCAAREVCFALKEPAKNCRSCANASMTVDGRWSCDQHNVILEKYEPCEFYQLNEMLEIDYE